MYTTEITVNHSDGDRVSYDRTYKMSQTFEHVGLAAEFIYRFKSCYNTRKNNGILSGLNDVIALPVHIDGIYDKIVSIKVVLVKDYEETL